MSEIGFEILPPLETPSELNYNEYNDHKLSVRSGNEAEG